MDDRLGRQLPWADEECPDREQLSHYAPDGVAAPCVHCHALVIHRLDLEAMFTRPTSDPVTMYSALSGEHGRIALKNLRSLRPHLSKGHSDTARLLQRAIWAERENPRPDFVDG